MATTPGCSTNDGRGGAGGSGGTGGSGAGAGAGAMGGGAGMPSSGGMGAGASSGAGSGGGGNAAGKSNDPTAGTSGAAGAGATSGAGGGGGASGAGGTGGATGGAATGGAGAGGAASVTDKVTKSASTYMFKHFPIEVNADGVWNGPTSPAATPMTTAYDTWVLENGYLKVTILPSYGGRILSILHKPTNRELLYQNPIGTPYLMQEGIFYYDYLVIMGGIFPSFPEPEHGKYWNQPYDFEVVSESPEAVTVRMSRKDDKDLAAGVPEKYDVGRTDVLVQLEVTLRAGSSALDLSTKLTNTRSTAVPSFEYWTVTTLAPGSMPGQTAIPLDTRILAQMDQVHCLESSWAWFGDAEERVSGEVFKWKNLVQFKNWADQGTCFANPKYSANWSGLANDTSHMNYLRVSKNEVTPGLKLWTFGKQSLSIDINDADTWLRPTIEMWHGVTPEFWSRGTLAANEVRTWSDRYFATLGLQDITAASENGAAYLSSSASGSDTVLSAAATLTLPNQTVKAVLKLGGTVVAEKDVVVAADAATTVTATVPSSQAAAGAVFQADFLQGDQTLLSAQTTLK
ncbi:MAG TPA: DUF5107 domain-containing protein [Polyangiaceae bacterium]|nr:DUF5107 domain-containing protein [Polyangiaceae bacterium]